MGSTTGPAKIIAADTLQLLLMLLAFSKAGLYCTSSLPESQGIFAEICRTNAEKPKFGLFDAKKAA